MFVPTKAFLTKGVGRHKEKLTSFEMALRDAHLANFNLVRVSSIFPPHCELVDREEGLSLLKPGQIVFAVIAESSTNEPSRLVAASIGGALPANESHHGYISEHHSYGQNEVAAGDYAEDLAASMLATVLGVPFDSELRRVHHRIDPRAARRAARDGTRPRALVRRGIFPHLRRARCDGIGAGRAAAPVAGVARSRRGSRGGPVRPLSARRPATGIPDARAEAAARPQAARVPGIDLRGHDVWRGMDPVHRPDSGCHPHAGGRAGQRGARLGSARCLLLGTRDRKST